MAWSDTLRTKTASAFGPAFFCMRELPEEEQPFDHGVERHIDAVANAFAVFPASLTMKSSRAWHSKIDI